LTTSDNRDNKCSLKSDTSAKNFKQAKRLGPVVSAGGHRIKGRRTYEVVGGEAPAGPARPAATPAAALPRGRMLEREDFRPWGKQTSANLGPALPRSRRSSTVVA